MSKVSIKLIGDKNFLCLFAMVFLNAFNAQYLTLPINLIMGITTNRNSCDGLGSFLTNFNSKFITSYWNKISQPDLLLEKWVNSHEISPTIKIQVSAHFKSLVIVSINCEVITRGTINCELLHRLYNAKSEDWTTSSTLL